MTNHPNRAYAASQRALARVQADHEAEIAELIELAADEAWGALKDARQRGVPAAQAITHARCIGMAARLVGDRNADDVDGLAEAIVHAFGLRPVVAGGRFEAVRPLGEIGR
jgi:hypothetical protein